MQGSSFLTIAGGIMAVPLYYYFVLHDSHDREKTAEAKLKNALMKEERVVLRGIQNRIYALFSRRELVAITSSRIILIRRSLFGGFSMKDYQWKDLRDAKISENIIPDVCGSKLSFVVSKSQTGITVNGIPSDIAAEIYIYAQTQEQEWEEKNRIRALEDKRAASGAAMINVGNESKAALSGASMMERIEQAKRLLTNGAISDAEYQEMKSKIINFSTV